MGRSRKPKQRTNSVLKAERNVIMERAIFRKKLYFEHMLKTKELNDDIINLYRNLSDNETDWVDWLDGKDITDEEIPSDSYLKTIAGIETIFIINRYNDFAEWEGRIVLHPDWVERIKDENSF